MSFLFGSAPKASFSTQPTTNQTQSGIQNLLASLLSSGQTPAGVQAYTGNFAAPTSPLQNTSLAGLQSIAGGAGVTPQQTSTGGNALTALNGAFNFAAPQVTAPTAAAPSTVVAPQIATTQDFLTGVAAPLEQNFAEQTLPAIEASYGGTAGGAGSSGRAIATGAASKALDQTLSSEAGLYDLAGQQANQGASLTAQTANQAAGQQTNLADLSALLSTLQGNQSASLTGQGDILSALGITPNVIGAPAIPGADTASILSTTLAGGAVPQTTQQTQLTGQYQDFLNQINQANTLRQLLAGFGTTPTQSTNAVGTGGQTGLLQGLATGAAGNAGLGTALAALLA